MAIIVNFQEYVKLNNKKKKTKKETENRFSEFGKIVYFTKEVIER